MTALDRFGAVILAAGLSRRMGGPNKLLEIWRGKPLLAHVLSAAAGLGLGDCIVVTGRDAANVGKLAAAYGLRSAHNKRHAEGIGTSIATGAASLQPDLDGIFVALGDMPLVERADYAMLAEGFRRRAILLPTYNGAKGHPVLFCTSYRWELSALAGDEGARSLIRQHVDATLEVVSHNSGVVMDFDRSEDFAREENS